MRRVLNRITRATSTALVPLAHPPIRRAKGVSRRMMRFCLRRRIFVAFFLLLLLLFFFSIVAYFSPDCLFNTEGDGVWFPPATDPRISSVQGLDELRAFCHANASALETATWVKDHTGEVGVGPGMMSPMYYIDDVPVCIGWNGEVLVDHVRYHSGQSALRRHANFQSFPLYDSAFVAEGRRGHAVAVPALGFFMRGRGIDRSYFALVQDCLGAFAFFFTRYASGELLTLPTQTVLLHDRWARVRSFPWLKRAMARAAQILNSFSSPLSGGPFFSTSPTVIVRRPSGNVGSAVEERLSRPLLHCFCQAMSVQSRTLDETVLRGAYHTIQDLVSLYFGEEDYRHGYALADTERRRRASRPWAMDYWNESAFDASGTYRPRALVIQHPTHRINNYEEYLVQMRSMGFRVVDVMPTKVPFAVQYHLSRYADVVLGINSVELATALWMDHFPAHCRVVVEFGTSYSEDVPTADLANTLKKGAAFHHVMLGPKKLTQTGAMMMASYDSNAVTQTLQKVQQRLYTCLSKSESVPRFSPILQKSVT